MGAGSLAFPAVYNGGQHIQHIHTMTPLSVQLPHECFRTFNLQVSTDTPDSSSILIITRTYPSLSWGSWTCFSLLFTKEGSNVVTACDRHEFTPIRALLKQRMKMPEPSCLDIFIILVYVLFPFSRSTFQSQGLAMSKQQDKDVSVIRVHQARDFQVRAKHEEP